MLIRYAIAYNLHDGTAHRTAPRFTTAEEADRWASLVRRDPAVTSARVVPVQLQPVAPLKEQLA
jgi:hypothetical protein